MNKFPEHTGFNLSEINKEVLGIWQKEDLFRRSGQDGLRRRYQNSCHDPFLL